MYLSRHIESVLLEAVSQFPVIAVMGARQVGKSTLLKHLFEKAYTYISFDDIALRSQAKNDPALFLKNFPGKLILDEIQYVPEILPEIKIQVDSKKEPGRFLLTGSQQYHLIGGLRESLAGRILLLHLSPMTLPEKSGMGHTVPWLRHLLEGGGLSAETFRIPEIDTSPARAIHQGGLPGILSIAEKFRHAYFESFIKTYLERDISSLFPGSDTGGLSRFLRLLAPLSSAEINKSQLGRDVGISPPTSARWLDWLKTTYVWDETLPYFANHIKKISKHPKGSLFDTGVICSLLMIPDEETLTLHPLIGSLFEASQRIEMRAVIDSCLLPAKMYHWRTHQGSEVDIVLEHKSRLYAFECKWTSFPDKRDAAKLLKFRDTFKDKTAFLGIITPTGHFGRIAEDVYQIPWIPK